ncbi:MAG: cupin domain-containing protein [Candidatus Ventricola sp.]
MRKGDSFSYKPSVQHYLINTGKTPATVLWVSTPPNF